MKKTNILKRTSALVVSLTVLTTSITAFGHSGRTDSRGGHRDNKNVSGLDSYHYHHGMGAHPHPKGVCPYSSKSKAKSASKNKSSKSKSTATSKAKSSKSKRSSSSIRAVQAKLNKLGYKCGTPDGVAGPATRKALGL